MVKYNDDARFLANLIKDKNKMKASIAGSADIIQVGKRSTELIDVEVFNVKVRTHDLDSDSFALSLPSYAILGTSTLGGGYTDWANKTLRKFMWNSSTELNEGTYDSNIDVSHGDIRFK